MNKGEVYFYQDEYYVFWMKVIEDNGEYFRCISSYDYNEIKDVKVDKIEDYLEKQIITSMYGTFVMKYEDLSKPFSKEYQERQMFPYLFESFMDEIEKDYNGNEELFLRHKKWEICYKEPEKFKGVKKYDYRSFPSTTVLDSEIILPLNKVLKDYPELYTEFGVILPCRKKQTLRKYYIDNFLELV